MAPLLLTFLFIGIGWFIIIRPQQERARAQRATVASLAVGDCVVSAGGIHGTVTELTTETVGLEVAPGVVLTLARPAIARRIDTDTLSDDAADRETGEDAELDVGPADTLVEDTTPGPHGPSVADDEDPETDRPIGGGRP